MQAKITTIITCLKCGGDIKGGESDYIIRCPYCGVEYQVSISAIIISPADVEEKIRLLMDCVIGGNPRERNEACLELAKIKDWRVVTPVIEAYKTLTSNADNYLDMIDTLDSLLEIIKKMDDPGAAGVLAKALEDDSAVMRMQAAHALENITDPSTASALIAVALNPDDMARSAYMDALGSFKDERIPPLLVSALKDKQYYVKCAALRSLAKQKYTGALNEIMYILDDKSDRENDGNVSWEEVRKWAAYALGKIGNESAMNPLLRALEDRDVEVSRAAANALSDIGGSSSDNSIKDKIDRVLKDRMN